MLRSRVPACVLWGPDGVMIYNDAYSVIAGGRHQRCWARRCWKAGPRSPTSTTMCMKVVLAGGTLAYRDQELTLHRTGKPEQVVVRPGLLAGARRERRAGRRAWPSSSRPRPRSQAENWQSGERDRQRQMFEQAPGFMAMLTGPDHVFELTNAAYRQLVGHRDVSGPARARGAARDRGPGLLRTARPGSIRPASPLSGRR